MLVRKIDQAPAVFGTVLRKHRLAAGLSQEQLGLEAEVQRNFISLIERGLNQPTITTVLRLAGALNLSAHELMKETEDQLRSGERGAA